MELLDRFDRNQQIIEQFVLYFLSDVRGDLGRLHAVACLRHPSTGNYHHPGLRAGFPAPAIHQALSYCHEELFRKFLEKTLREQESEFRKMFSAIGPPAFEIANRWLELEYFRMVVPHGTPAYLRELFFSDTRVILHLIVSEHAISTAA